MNSTKLPLLRLLVLTACAFVVITAEVLPVGLLPVIAKSLHKPDSSVGLLVSSYALVVAVMSIPVALLTTKWNRRNFLVVLLAIYAFSNLLIATTHLFALMVGARMLAGLVHAAILPTIVAIAVDSVPRSRVAHAVAFVSGGGAAAFSIGVPICTSLGTTFGWRLSYLGVTGLFVALLIAVLFVVKAQPVRVVEQLHAPHLLLLRPKLLVLAGGIVVMTVGHYAAYTYVSPILLHSGVSVSGVGPILFAYGVAGILGLAIAGRVGGKYPQIVLFGSIGTAVIALGAIAGFTDAAVATAVAVIVWGASFGGLPAILQTAALEQTPEDAGIAPALVNSVWNVGIFGGSAIGGHLLSIGPEVPALFAAAFLLTSLSLLLPVLTQRSAVSQASEPLAA